MHLAPRKKDNKHKYKYIPKKIFQTGETNEVNKGMYDAVHTWIDKNPDWDYYYFDNMARRAFIQKYFPKKVLDAYDDLIPGAYKADLWRYCVLYIHGGLYVDNKCELLESSLNNIIPEYTEFLSLQEMGAVENDLWGVSDLRLLQAFIVAKPKHDFLEKAIYLIVENVRTGYYGYTPVCPTGPRALGRAIQLVLKKKEVNPNWLGVNDISGYKFIFWPDMYLYKSSKFKFNYNGYLKEQLILDAQKDIGKFYRYAWYMDKIYSHGKVLRPKYNSFNKKIIKFDVYQSCFKRLVISKRYKELVKIIFYSIRKNRFSYFGVIEVVSLIIFKKIAKVFANSKE